MPTRKKIEALFGVPVKSCRPVLKSMGLKIEFARTANLVQMITMPKPNRYASKELCDLVNNWGFVVLTNASLDAAPNVDASGSKCTTQVLFQDPFHYDEQWTTDDPDGVESTCLSTEGHVTVLQDPEMRGRLAPTFYASMASVRTAIRKLNRNGLPPDVIEAVEDQASDAYSFTFHPADFDSREILQRKWPQYTRNVFDLIPEGERYAKEWRVGENEIIIHSNTPEILHARPSSNSGRSFLQSQDICPDVK